MKTVFLNRLVGRWSALAVALALPACHTDTPAPAPELPEHLALGNPSGATPDLANYTNYLLSRPQYALAYHRDQGKPTWVSWHLSSAWLGAAPRQDDFRPDPDLPAGWYRTTASSYTGSGFDRGHNCPSADRTRTEADNSATFLMTNMMPQAPRLNQQLWANLEDYCRTLVSQGNELYIVCGGYGRGGSGANGFLSTLDQGRVTVPARCWKTIVVLPTGLRDAARVGSSTRVIAVDVPNDNALTGSWGQYRTTVDAIEAATGLDLLSAVAPATQQVLEARPDVGPTN